MIYRFDADANGTDSIQHLVDAKLVTNIPVDSVKAFEAQALRLVPSLTADDLVIVDTMSSFAATARMNYKFDEKRTIWDQRELFFNDKQYLAVYNAVTSSAMQIAVILANRARLIVVMHEDMERDLVTGMKSWMPDANPALFKMIRSASSDILRLRELYEPLTDDKGKVIAPAGTRLLQLRKSEDTLIKTQVPMEVGMKLPKNLANPTLPKLYEVLQKKPKWLTIFGSPGVGKTTLATSDAQATYDSHKKEEA